MDDLEDQLSGPKSAADILRKVRFPFESGMASCVTIDKIQSRKDDPLALALSASITQFFDRCRGQVSVIYMDPVAIEQLLDDVQLLSAGGDDLLQAALPFDGSWQARPKGLHTDAYVNFGLKLVALGLTDVDANYFRRAIRGDKDCSEAYYNPEMLLAG